MAGTAERLVLHSEERARASEPTQESIARLLDVYDQASTASRRRLYERALFLQYGLLLQVVREHPDVLEEMQAALP